MTSTDLFSFWTSKDTNNYFTFFQSLDIELSAHASFISVYAFFRSTRIRRSLSQIRYREKYIWEESLPMIQFFFEKSFSSHIFKPDNGGLRNNSNHPSSFSHSRETVAQKCPIFSGHPDKIEATNPHESAFWKVSFEPNENWKLREVEYTFYHIISQQQVSEFGILIRKVLFALWHWLLP